MARLPYLDRADLPPEQQGLLARPINLHRVLVHAPGAARAFGVLGRYIRHESPLDPRLREMAILQVGWEARAPYEWSHHLKIGRDFGVSEADVHGLIAEAGGGTSELDEAARLVLRAAREATAGAGVSAGTFEALRAHLSAEGLTELVVVIGFYCGVVRILESLGVDVEPEYQTWLEQFPLPG